MNVWIVGDGITFPYGNATTNRLTEIAKGFISIGMKVKLVPFKRQKFLGYKDNIGRYKDVKYQYYKGVFDKKLPFLLKIFSVVFFVWKVKKIVNALEEDKVSIILCGTSSISTILMLFFASRRNNIKLIYDIVEEPFSTWRSRKLFELSFKQKLYYLQAIVIIPFYYFFAWRLPDYLTCITDELKQRLHEIGLGSRIIYVLPIIKHIENKLDRPAKNKLAVENNFIHSGSSFFIKDGLEEIVNAVRILKGKGLDIILEFYGDISQQNRKKLVELIRKYNIEDRVFIKGHVSLDVLYKSQRECLAQICYKSLSLQNRYNFATKIIDYLDAGRPVILSNLPVHMKYFTNEHDALITSGYSGDDLALCMEYLYNNRKKADAIGLQGKHTLKEKFSSTKHIMAMLKVFKLL